MTNVPVSLRSMGVKGWSWSWWHQVLLGRFRDPVLEADFRRTHGPGCHLGIPISAASLFLAAGNTLNVLFIIFAKQLTGNDRIFIVICRGLIMLWWVAGVHYKGARFGLPVQRTTVLTIVVTMLLWLGEVHSRQEYYDQLCTTSSPLEPGTEHMCIESHLSIRSGALVNRLSVLPYLMALLTLHDRPNLLFVIFFVTSMAAGMAMHFCDPIVRLPVTLWVYGYGFGFLFFVGSLDRLLRQNFLQIMALRKTDAVQSIANELQQLIDHANAPIFGIDAKGCVNEWNHKVAEITGFTVSEAMGAHLVDTFIAPSFRTSVATVLSQALSGQGTDNYELAFQTKSDEIKTFLVNATTRRDVEQTIIGVVGVAQDVTELLHVTTQNAANQERAEAEHAFNEYIAHEVRNPLSVAIMGTDALVEDVGASGPDDPQLETIIPSLNVIKTNLLFMLEMLSSVLDMNKLAKGQINLSHDRFDLREHVLEPVATMLRAKANNVEVILECPPDIRVCGDEFRLKQVLMNLGANSLKYTMSGFVRLRGEAIGLTEEEDDETEPGTRRIRVSVEDSGSGIAADKRALLFQKYQTLNGSAPGTGIGLYLCQAIVEAMGGTLKHNPDYRPSNPDNSAQGCQMVIDLKLPAGGDSSTEGNVQEEACPGAPAGAVLDQVGLPLGEMPTQKSLMHLDLRVLIVDDSRMMRLVLSKALKGIGGSRWKIDQAINGEEAIRMTESNTYHLVTMDHYMGESGGKMTGDQAIAQMRSQDGGAANAVLLGCSGNDMTSTHSAAGADLFLRKPLTFDPVVCMRLHQLLVKRVGLPPEWVVLVAEDMDMGRKLLVRKLRQLGRWAARWTILEAESGASAMRMVEDPDDEHARIDVAILDQDLGDSVSGNDVAEAVAKKYPGCLLVRMSATPTRSAAGIDGGGHAHGPLPAASRPHGGYDLVWNKPPPPREEMEAGLGMAWYTHGRS